MDAQTLYIDLAVPQGWHELGDDKLEMVFSLISQEFPLPEIQTICLLRWSGITVVGRHDLGTRLCRKGKRSFVVSDEQIASLLPFLDWLGGVPPLPVRLSHIGKADALNADFQEVPFSTFIFCDNLYQGVLQSQQYADGILNEEQYNQALEDEDMRHLGVVRDIYQQQSHANHAMWEQQRRDAAEAMKMFNGNVDLTHRPQISAQTLVDAGWEGAGGPNDIATVYSSQYGIVDDQGATREILVTPILPDGSVLSETELEEYIHDVLEGSSDILAADTKGIVIAVDVDPDGSAGETLHQLQEQFYSLVPPHTDWDIYNQKYLPANDEYLNRANSIQTRKSREAQQEQDAYDQQYQKTWDFMMPDDKNKRDYDDEMHWLNEVYNHEMELAVDNEERKLQLTRAYNIAKIALAKKYGQEQHAAFVEAINKSAEWLNSDGGKALTQSMSTLANGMSQIFSQVTAMMQADLEIQTNEINKRYDAEISRAEGNSYQVKKLEEQKQKEIAKAKNEANRKMFAMQVIQAVVQAAQGQYIFFVDDDAEPTREAVGAMLSHMEKNPSTGVCAVALRDAEGNLQQSFKDYPGVGVKVRNVLRSFTGSDTKASAPDGVIHPCYVIGACQMIRSELFRQLGLLDDRIFYGPEDADFCIRVAAAGYSIDYLPHPSMLHHWRHISRRNIFSRTSRLHIAALWHFYRKHRRFF